MSQETSKERVSALISYSLTLGAKTTAETFGVDEARLAEILDLVAKHPADSTAESVVDLLTSGALTGSDLLYMACGGLQVFTRSVGHSIETAESLMKISKALRDLAKKHCPTIDW